MKRNESELAGVCGRSGHHNASRFEQCLKLLVAGPGTQHSAIRGHRRELDQAVNGHHAPAGLDDEWVDVDARDVAAFCSQATEAGQDLDQLGAIDRRLATEFAEQLLCCQVVDHLEGRDRVNRCRTEHHISDRLGKNAADAEHHGGSELRIPNNAGDQLTIAADHWRNEDVDLAVVRMGSRQQVGRRLLDGCSIAEPELDQAAFRLMRNGIAVQLCHHRVAKLIRRLDRCSWCAGETFTGNGHAVVGEQRLAVSFGERRGIGRVMAHQPANLLSRPPEFRTARVQRERIR